MSRPWHESEAFWERVRPFVLPPETVEEAAEQLDRLLELADIDPELADLEPGSVLDVPCGVGRHAVELAERGFDVTGVDATRAYLDAAEERAREAGVDVEFVYEDIVRPRGHAVVRAPRRLRRGLHLYTSFGYFEDEDDDERVAANFHESLGPGGTLVMSLAGKETLARGFQPRSWEERDGAYFLEERAVTDDWRWLENRWVLVEDGEAREFEVSHRVYSASELTDLLREAGVGTVDVYGDFEGGDYDHEAERLVVVAEK